MSVHDAAARAARHVPGEPLVFVFQRRPLWWCGVVAEATIGPPQFSMENGRMVGSAIVTPGRELGRKWGPTKKIASERACRLGRKLRPPAQRADPWR